MIYLDNAATSFPKAEGVAKAVSDFINENCFNINRGAYSLAFKTEQIVFETRESLAKLFGCQSAKQIIFTSGATQSINMALGGVLKQGDKVITSQMDHNAVLRPLQHLKNKGKIELEIINCNNNGEISLTELEIQLKTRPKMLILTHASNICGTIMPITEIGELCKKYGVFFVVDAAQTAGVIDINIQRDNIDILCFSAHKGLLALQGLGGMALSNSAAEQIQPVVFGGTGSFSNLLDMPKLLPDKLEAGTLNLVGIAALHASLDYIQNIGMENIFAAQKNMQNFFEAGIKEIKNVRLVGSGAKNRCAVSSVDFLSLDNSTASFLLDSKYGIMTRSGLHCAPLAHKAIGTYPKGTVRFSFSHTVTKEDIQKTLLAIKEITKQ